MRIETTERIIFEHGDVVEWKPKFGNKRGERLVVDYQDGDIVRFTIGTTGLSSDLQLVKPVKHCVNCGREVEKDAEGPPKHVEPTLKRFFFYCDDDPDSTIEATIHGTWDTPDPESVVTATVESTRLVDVDEVLRLLEAERRKQFRGSVHSKVTALQWAINAINALATGTLCPHSTKVCQACQEVME